MTCEARSFSPPSVSSSYTAGEEAEEEAEEEGCSTRRTLRASHLFARLALPFFAAKLADDGDDDDEATERRQALQGLALLGPFYGAASLGPHADRIGDALADLLTPPPGPLPPVPAAAAAPDGAAPRQTRRRVPRARLP